MNWTETWKIKVALLRAKHKPGEKVKVVHDYWQEKNGDKYESSSKGVVVGSFVFAGKVMYKIHTEDNRLIETRGHEKIESLKG